MIKMLLGAAVGALLMGMYMSGSLDDIVLEPVSFELNLPRF